MHATASASLVSLLHACLNLPQHTYGRVGWLCSQVYLDEPDANGSLMAFAWMSCLVGEIKAAFPNFLYVVSGIYNASVGRIQISRAISAAFEPYMVREANLTKPRKNSPYSKYEPDRPVRRLRDKCDQRRRIAAKFMMDGGKYGYAKMLEVLPSSRKER